MEALILYGLGFALMAFVGVLAYNRSVNSRQHYTCPECGEKVRVELMDASHCSVCGTPLTKDPKDNT